MAHPPSTYHRPRPPCCYLTTDFAPASDKRAKKAEKEARRAAKAEKKAAAAAAALPEMTDYLFEVDFAAGPLGLGFAVLADGTFKIERVSGQAEALGIEQNDAIVAVGGNEVTGMTKAQFVGQIQSLGRPVAVRFSRLMTVEEATLAAADDAAPDLPAGWVSQYDPESQSAYFFNEATGETTWDVPVDEGAAHIEQFRCSFGEGSLGLGFAVLSDGTFKIERSGGQAATMGVETGDIIHSLGGHIVQGMTKSDFVSIVQATPRPIEVVFERGHFS